MESFSFAFPAIIICELLGIPSAGRHAFRGWTDAHEDDDHRKDHVQRAVYPPSITSSLPVTNFASSDAR